MNSHHHIVRVMQLSFVKHDLPEPSAASVSLVVGLSLSTAVKHLLKGQEEELTTAVTETYRQLYRDLPSDYALYAGVRETLDILQERGYWLGLVTGKSHAGLQRALAEFDLEDYFLVVRTADHCPSKPHPAMVHECMQEMGVGSAQTTVIGDASLDMQMASASGAKGLGVSFGVADKTTLLKAGASHVVDRFSELLEHFPHLQEKQPSSTIR
jgi:phosphoglycolate phosphatase